MFLTSIIIGDNEGKVDNNWGLSKDSYGNAFIKNESINQRIQLGYNVEDTLEMLACIEDIGVYKITDKAYISNNYNNMNLTLINLWNKKKVNDKEKIVYVTLMNKSYKLVSYTPHNNEIIQTYKLTQEYQGAVIKCTDTKVMSLVLKDNETKKFVSYTINLNEDNSFRIEHEEIEDKKKIKKFSDVLKALGKKHKNFLISAKDKIPTSTVIIDSNNVDESIMEVLRENKNLHILDLDSEKLKNSPEEYESLFTEELVNKRIRAVTTIGVRLPKDFFRTYRIICLFNYDKKLNKYYCVRSN